MPVALALKNLSVAITALIFNLVLIWTYRGYKEGRRMRNWRYREILYGVAMANAVACVSYFLRHADVAHGLLPVGAVFYVLIFLCNVYVAYYFYMYVISYFGGDVGDNTPKHRIDKVILNVASVIILSVMPYMVYRQLGMKEAATLPIWFYFPIAYLIELYFVVCAAVHFTKNRAQLPERDQGTLIGGFALTIGFILFEIINPTGMVMSHLGATLGLMMFFIGAESPDYYRLIDTMDELERAKDDADEANRTKSDFLASMSHEIRTPINAVIGMNEMILRECKDVVIVGYARNVESAGKNLLSIINDILDFSKIEAGKMELSEGNYSLSSVLNDVTNMIVFQAKSKGLSFDAQVDPELPDILYGDSVRIRQVIVNILTNAVKYTKKGYVNLSVNGEIKDYRGARSVILFVAVKDSGIGIREDDKDKLFNVFERVDLQKTNNIEGTGLGLAITRQLLTMMGGKITVDSVYGKGSTFTITVPQLIMKDEPIGDFEEKFKSSFSNLKEYHETFRAPDAHILVVDDMPMNLTVVQGLLKKTEVKIDTAVSGIEALSLTGERQYDLILLDQRMPHMDGTEALEKMREQEDGKNIETPVICLTADAVSGARERYMNMGFTDYLTKPVEGYAIEATLMKYLPPGKVMKKVILKDPEEAVSGISMKDMSPLEEFYFKAEALNYGEAMRFQEDEALLQETLRQFLDTIEENAGQIEKYLGDANYRDYTTKVHALKTAARLIGAGDLSAMAMELEEKGNLAQEGYEKAITDVNNQTPGLIEHYRALKPVIDTYFEEDIEIEKIPMPDGRMEEFFEVAAMYVETFDYDSMEELLRDVDRYIIPEEYAEKIARMKKALANADWDQIGGEIYGDEKVPDGTLL